ncbi:MAG: gamma-glutamyl-gamma-aminobutyrate hydrolase family protein [Chloroflexota bacterium]
MKRPLIGITTYHRDEKGYVRLPGQYADAVRRAGGLPLLLQPGETELDQLLELLDGIVLSGGGDVDPKRYLSESESESESEEEVEVYWVNQERDEFELELARRISMSDRWPTLCICRGMQILNVALGGTLIPHIPAVIPEAIDHRQPPDQPYGPIPHEVYVEEDSELARIMDGDKVSTASWHHQAIGKVSDQLKVVATASDGIVEALEMPGRPALMAVQWHPELTAAEDGSQQKLFDELVVQAISRMKTK